MWDVLLSQQFWTVVMAVIGSGTTAWVSVRRFGAQRADAAAKFADAEEKARTEFRDEIRRENKELREEVSRLRTNLTTIMDEHMKCKVKTADLEIEVKQLRAEVAASLPPRVGP